MLLKIQISVIAIMAVNIVCIVSATTTTTTTAAPTLKQVAKLPLGVPTCAEDENINHCIRNAFNTMLHNSVKGLPDINVPPLDPWTQDRLNVQFSNSLIKGRAAAKNIRITGISKSSIKRIDYQRKGNDIKMKVNFHAPRLQIEGLYKAEVQISGGSKFSSKGKFNVTIIDVVSKSEHSAELYERDGHTYLRLTEVKLDPTLGNMIIKATGLVPDPILNEALVQIANQNWRAIYKSVIDATRPTWEPIILQFANEFFAHLPFDFLITKPQN